LRILDNDGGMSHDALPELPQWDRSPDDLTGAIVDIKRAMRRRISQARSRAVADVMAELDEFLEDELTAVDQEQQRLGSAWPELAFDEIEGDSVTAAQIDQLHRRGCLVVRRHFPDAQARQWDQDIERYVTSNRFHETYSGPGDDFFASVDSRPTIYPIYWSRPQMQARQSHRMATVQRFLNRLWTNQSSDRTWFDPDRNIMYPDRIRRRPPETSDDGLGAHIDTGNVDLWMTEAFQYAFHQVFVGEPLKHDPWNGAHRADALKFPGSTMCSAFRTFQGWTALSAMEQDQGVLHAIPIPLAITRLLLRPLLDDVAEHDLCGVTMNRVLPVTTQWHRRLLDGLSPVPDLQPGDSVWWHADLIHAVAPVVDQKGWASVMYIPASPWNDRNADYARSVQNAFLAGNSPDDFPAEHYEASWHHRFTIDELNHLGRAALGM